MLCPIQTSLCLFLVEAALLYGDGKHVYVTHRALTRLRCYTPGRGKSLNYSWGGIRLEAFAGIDPLSVITGIAYSHGIFAGSVGLYAEVEGGLEGVGGDDLQIGCFPMSCGVCARRPSRRRLCNGSGAEQDPTGMNWLRKLYPTEESHGEILATLFLARGWEDSIMLSPLTVYFPDTSDVAWLKSLICV